MVSKVGVHMSVFSFFSFFPVLMEFVLSAMMACYLKHTSVNVVTAVFGGNQAGAGVGEGGPEGGGWKAPH